MLAIKILLLCVRYYAAPFVLYLVMSQFLIAIFVGAFDETREQIDLEEQEKQRRFQEQLENVVLVPSIPWRQRVAGILYFAVTWQSPWGGGTLAHALREVCRCNMHFEDDNVFNFDRAVVEESDVRARAELTVCSREVLEKHMSAKQADGLLRWFGCRVAGAAGAARASDGGSSEKKEALPTDIVDGGATAGMGVGHNTVDSGNAIDVAGSRLAP